MSTKRDGKPLKVVAIRPRQGSAPSATNTLSNSAPATLEQPTGLAGTPVVKWTPSQVSDWVKAQGFDTYAPLFVQHEVDGAGLLEVDNMDLSRMGVSIVGKRHALLRRVRTLAESPS